MSAKPYALYNIAEESKTSFLNNTKVKQSHYRPGEALRVPRG